MSSNPCVTPTQPEDLDGDNRWLSIHKRFLQECREKDPESEKKQFHAFCNSLTDSQIYSFVYWRRHTGGLVVYRSVQELRGNAFVEFQHQR